MSTETGIEELQAANVTLLKEVVRLRKINHELVCSHNDLLVTIVQLEAGQNPDLCACGQPGLQGVAHAARECVRVIRGGE